LFFVEPRSDGYPRIRQKVAVFADEGEEELAWDIGSEDLDASFDEDRNAEESLPGQIPEPKAVRAAAIGFMGEKDLVDCFLGVS
jgi:hypothetical protein